MDKMLDRVAQKMFDHLHALSEVDDKTMVIGSVDSVLIDGHVDLHALAAAVLAAMREPTKGMIQAGENVDPGYGDGNAPGESHWQAMVDAALSCEG